MLYNVDDLSEDDLDTSFENYMKDHQPFNSLMFPHFSSIECDEIVDYCEENYPMYRGLDRENNVVPYRNNDVCFISASDNFAKNLFSESRKILQISNSICKFDISHVSSIQFSRYEEGQYLNWHIDDGFAFNRKKEFLIRKMSVTTLLNYPDEFEGGEFELISPTEDGHKIESHKMTKGQALAIPSFVSHRVAPVTKGVRYSLVYWFYGKIWR